MNIDMDSGRSAYQLRQQEESKPSSFKWVIIIALGIFIGNTLSFGLEKAVFYWELKQVALAATAAMEQSSRDMATTLKLLDQKSTQQRKIMAAQENQRQIHQQQKQAGYRQAKETCDFWAKQLTTENTVLNRMNRDQACNLVNQFR